MAMSHDPFRGTEALASGRLSRGRLYGPRYRRVFPDVYLPAGVELDLAIRSRAAYLLVRDRGGVLAGYSAAVLLGADCAPADAPAEVLVAANTRAHTGLLVRRGMADDADVTTIAGCRVTAPVRTAWDLARRLPLVEGVVSVDALARVGRFRPNVLLARRAAHPGAPGSGRLDEVVALTDPRAESAMETRLRVELVRAGLPAPAVQYEIADEHDYVLARVDLAYPAVKLAIEYDGAGHEDPLRLERERERDGLLASYGWDTLRVGKDGMGLGLAQTVSRVRQLLVVRSG
jgi:very-short-patch-repair endonuclease